MSEVEHRFSTSLVAQADLTTTRDGDPWAGTAESDTWASPAQSASDAASPWDTPASAAQDPWASAPTASAAQDPWASAPTASAAQDPWASAPAASAADAGTGWTAASSGEEWGAATASEPEAGFDWQQLWDGSLPLDSWINQGLEWMVESLRPVSQVVRVPIDAGLAWVEGLLTGMPALAMVVLLGLLAWQFAGPGMAAGTVVALLLMALLGVWNEAMVTLSLVLTALFFCIAIGLPMGIALASSDRAQRWSRPLLDAMQTTPAFVYLVPVVMLFGIGNVPGVIVTIIFALPPLVRLTNLGIRQVRPDLVEAAVAYGASPWQLLMRVQLPLAMPAIMAGVNQALMLCLSMVVIASMIAVGGLGQMVLRGIGRLDMGLATVGGLGIVLLAITLDRLTQALGAPRRDARRWWQSGPAGLVARLLQHRLRRARRPDVNAGHASPQPNPRDQAVA